MDHIITLVYDHFKRLLPLRTENPPVKQQGDFCIHDVATAYFASVYLGKRAKLVILVQHIQRAAKRICGVPEFRFYAIADGIKQLLFDRNTGIGPPPANPCLNLLPLFS